MGVNPSGILPLVYDTAPNTAGYDNLANTGGSIGGNPMADGPFPGSNFNFQFAALTVTHYDPNGQIINFNCSTGSTYPGAECCWVVPIPATVWLFGSGLVGLLGIARRRPSLYR